MGLKDIKTKPEFHATQDSRYKNLWLVKYLKYAGKADKKGRPLVVVKEMKVVGTFAHAKRVFYSTVQGRVVKVLEG